jgi:large subunit ribosomal protein L35
MPKIKTNRGAAKRFKKSASGRIKRGGAFTSHILTPKSRKRKRNLRQGGMVAAVDQKNITKLIPYM